jgi:cell volume regulation protein A
MTAADLPLELLVGAGTVIAAVVAARLAHSPGLPALLVFLGLGLALGESGAGIQFSDAGVAEVLGLGALILILAEGGLTTNWSHARPAMGGALLLATVGVAVATVVVAALAHGLLGFGWRSAFLLGAVLAPTDAAAVFRRCRACSRESQASTTRRRSWPSRCCRRPGRPPPTAPRHRG